MTSTLLFQRFKEEAEKEIAAQSDALARGTAADFTDYKARAAQVKTWKAALTLAKRLDREVLGLPKEEE